MSKQEKTKIYFTSIDGKDVIKQQITELNDDTTRLRNKTTDESTWKKQSTADEDTCKLIQLLEEPVDMNVNTIHKKHVNVVDDKSAVYSEKKSLNRRSDNGGPKPDPLHKYSKDYSLFGGKTKADLNTQKYKDHSYSDLSSNKNGKDISHSQGTVKNSATGNPLGSTNDNKNISVTKTNPLSQVKNINDLKKVIPKVKILGAEVNTLKELTQAHSNNKQNTMESKSPKIFDSRKLLNNYCRTCAGLKIPLVDIFSDRGVQMRLNQQMKHLENIDQHDSLSTQMCMDCICDLKMSYKFFMQIKKAQVKLKSIHVSLNATSVRVEENESILPDNNPSTPPKSDSPWKTPAQSNQQQSSSSLESIRPSTEHNNADNYSSSKELTVEPVDNWEDETKDNDDEESLEEFDPEDHQFESIDFVNVKTEPDTEIEMEETKLCDDESISVNDTKNVETSHASDPLNNKITIATIDQYNSKINSSIKIESEDVTLDSSLTSCAANDNSDITKENMKQPNILKRKATWHGKTTNSTNNTDLTVKDAKVHKLNTVNISPSDEEGIMYVTVKGSKPNELLLVKVKKMDKLGEKKDDKSAIKKLGDVKPLEKAFKTMPLKDLFAPKKTDNREAIIEEQIEQYKKKREKLLGGGTGAETAISIAANAIPIMVSTREIIEVDDSSMGLMNYNSNSIKNSANESKAAAVAVKEKSTDNCTDEGENNQFENEIEEEEEKENEIKSLEQDKAQNSELENSKEYLNRLTIIKQKWEEAKVKKELLQKELDDSYAEGNLEKLSKILGEKEKNLHQFQDYLKQRKIVITRLKDEDIISLYEDRNIVTVQNKLPDLIDENQASWNLGDSNILDCDYCPQIFSTRSTLEEHLKTHDYKILYFCEDCCSEFPNNKARRAHNITCIKKLICKYCDFMLDSKGKKRQHEQKHCDTIFGQLCDICGEKFKHQGTLDQHIKTQHMNWEKVYQCPKCPKKFAFKQKLSFHLKSVHTTLRAYLCEDCGADFKNPASLRHHRIRKHQPTSNKRECPVCHKLVPFYSLSKHMYTHKAYTIECPHCDKMFKNTSTLKQHVRIHEDQRQYRCDTCGVGFNRRDGLRLHMRVHQKTDSRALKECSCQICSEKFPNHSMLVIHRNRVHKDGKQYTCHICNRSMLSTRSLEWHMSHIHNETPMGVTPDESSTTPQMKRVSCNHCDKTFKTEMILRTHIKNTHVEKNPVKCIDCDLMFTSEVRLRHHMMTAHNRLEGTLTCPHCPKRFVNQLRLKTHMISHSEERPYSCEICGFNLKTKIQLIKHHQNRHSDERPLQCRYCPWRCKQVSALVCHERTHTNERPYSCIVCKQRFKYLGDKNKHERRHESLGGSGFKRIVAGRNVKQSKNHDGEVSQSDHDLLEQDYETIDDNLTEQQVEYDIKYDEEQHMVKFEEQEMDNEEHDPNRDLDHEQDGQQEIDDDEDEEEEEDDEGDDYDEEEEEDAEHLHQEEVAVDDEYMQVHKHQYEEISREASEAAEVIMNIEDATVYTEEVTADNIENAEMITAEMMTDQILQTGAVVHIQQQDDNGKIQMIPVMLSLPDLTDSTTEINLATGSIMYNN